MSAPCICPKRGHHPDDLPKCLCAAGENSERDAENRRVAEEWRNRTVRFVEVAAKMGVELEVADV